MKKYDFLFLCEVPVREIQSYTLLCLELRRRGYSAGILFEYEWQYPLFKHKAKVLVCNVINCEERFATNVYDVAGKSDKIVCMHWEQILGNFKENNLREEARCAVTETGKTINRFCWGESFRKILLDNGADNQYVYVSGGLHLDFLKKQFNGFYQSRSYLCKQYGINENDTIILFNSSFILHDAVSWVNDMIRDYLNGDEELFQERYHFEDESLNMILEWFSKYLQEHPDVSIIYRPHPMEVISTKFKDLQEKQKFYVIKDFSVQQWISIVDIVTTVSSTSLTEAVYNEKTAICLRPIEMPYKFDNVLFENIAKVNNYEDFCSAVKGEKNNISAEDFEYYYHYREEPVYKDICNRLEEILQNDCYNTHWSDQAIYNCKHYYLKRKFKVLKYVVIKKWLHSFIKIILYPIAYCFKATRNVKLHNFCQRILNVYPNRHLSQLRKDTFEHMNNFLEKP